MYLVPCGFVQGVCCILAPLTGCRNWHLAACGKSLYRAVVVVIHVGVYDT